MRSHNDLLSSKFCFIDKVIKCVKKVGYEKAYSVIQGVYDHPYKIFSDYVERI